MGGITDTVISGPLVLAVVLAFAAGTVGLVVRRSGFVAAAQPAIQVAGGLTMIMLGLMVTGLWGQFISWLQVSLSGSTGVAL